MMPDLDPALGPWLEASYAEVKELEAESDIFRVSVVPAPFPVFRLEYGFRVPVMDGGLRWADRAVVDFFVPPDYLRTSRRSLELLRVLEPRTLYHANAREGRLCAGEFPPAFPLIEVAYQVAAVLMRSNTNLASPLDSGAAQFFRNRPDLRPAAALALKRPRHEAK